MAKVKPDMKLIMGSSPTSTSTATADGGGSGGIGSSGDSGGGGDASSSRALFCATDAFCFNNSSAAAVEITFVIFARCR